MKEFCFNVGVGMIEGLESRRLLAVTVNQGYPGYFEIDGDASADSISVSVNMILATMTVNGVLYSNVVHIDIYGGGGDDVISATTADTYTSIGAAIHGGNGNDSILIDFDGAVWGDNGDDTIRLRDAFRGEVYGGNGSDSIYAKGECIDAMLCGEGGDDTLDASENNDGIALMGGDGNDKLIGSAYADDLDGGIGSDTMLGGDGNDTFHAQDGYADSIDGGNGSDIVYADAVELNISNVEQVFS